MMSLPAEDSSSNRDSVFRSNAMFSIPLVGVLEEEEVQEVMLRYLRAFKNGLPAASSFPLPAGFVSNDIHVQLRGRLNDILHI